MIRLNFQRHYVQELYNTQFDFKEINYFQQSTNFPSAIKLRFTFSCLSFNFMVEKLAVSATGRLPNQSIELWEIKNLVD